MDTTFTSLDQVSQHALAQLAAHPERDLNAARSLALDGKKRRHPVISMNFLNVPDDHFVESEPAASPRLEIQDEEARGIAGEIMSKLKALDMLNPLSLNFDTGKGPGTLVTCFGVPLLPEASNTPAYYISPDEILDKPLPSPEAGLMRDIHQRIERLKALTPPDVKISRPDTQGPFNLVHSLVGDEAFLMPLTDPPKFHALMTMITDFFIQSIRTLRKWIGPEREVAEEAVARIAECSVNLISREMYEEFVLPYDLQIARTFGAPGIHTCSGPHVFHATLEDIPGIRYTEAGFIAKTAAGYTDVAMAVKAVKGKPIMLNIGQELPRGKEFETVRDDLDRYLEHPLLTFNYTGMHWRKQDKPLIRDLHRRLDEHWEKEILPKT